MWKQDLDNILPEIERSKKNRIEDLANRVASNIWKAKKNVY
jgi:hypothetical protein